MAPSNQGRALDRLDYGLAALAALAALAVYVRTLAPDLLYGDSGEFQTLAYTLGITHATGYPVYLLLARVLGFLPLRTFAWRVSLFSALGAGVTVGGVYLWARQLTRHRTGPLLGSLALVVSYTFWTQAILAEVYTPALAVIVIAALGLRHWYEDPAYRWASLLGATLIVGAGLGIHASVALFIPPAAAFVVWRLADPGLSAHDRQRGLLTALGGGLLGLALFVTTFRMLDAHDPPSSFINVTMIPSRSVWGLTRAELAQPWTRFWITVTGLQWQTAMFAEGVPGALSALGAYVRRLTSHEFSGIALLLALFGFFSMVRGPRSAPIRRAFGTLTLGAYLFCVAAIVNYDPPDWYVFFLPAHMLTAVAVGVGAGRLLEAAAAVPAADLRLVLKTVPTRVSDATLRSGVLAFIAAILALGVVMPFALSRGQALRQGRTHFSEEHYIYPVDHPEEPRAEATLRLSLLPDGAMVIMNWRPLYATYYVAHVEGLRPNIVIMEATPHGSQGQVAASLLDIIEEALLADQPVYSDEIYPPLQDHFRVLPAPGNLYRLTLLNTD